jgi:hypothetical protein
MAKMDKKEIVLSTVAGLAVVVIGYLVWKHEQTISAASAAQEVAANEEAANEVQSELQSLPTYSGIGFNGASGDENDDGSNASITSVPSDTNLAAILSAFFPTATQPTTSNPTGTGTSTTGSGTGTAPVTTTNGGGSTSTGNTLVSPTGTQRKGSNPASFGPQKAITTPLSSAS